MSPKIERQVRPGDDVGAAAVRIGAADLAVGDSDDGQQDRDRDGHLDREQQRARPGHDQDAQDLLGRIGR